MIGGKTMEAIIVRLLSFLGHVSQTVPVDLLALGVFLEKLQVVTF